MLLSQIYAFVANQSYVCPSALPSTFLLFNLEYCIVYYLFSTEMEERKQRNIGNVPIVHNKEVSLRASGKGYVQ